MIQKEEARIQDPLLHLRDSLKEKYPIANMT